MLLASAQSMKLRRLTKKKKKLKMKNTTFLFKYNKSNSLLVKVTLQIEVIAAQWKCHWVSSGVLQLALTKMKHYNKHPAACHTSAPQNVSAVLLTHWISRCISMPQPLVCGTLEWIYSEAINAPGFNHMVPGDRNLHRAHLFRDALWNTLKRSRELW